MEAELVIKGGEVIDGTGSPRFKADVAINAGRIVGIGDDFNGGNVVDATGYVVTPGFIDIHTHYDGQVFFDPLLTPSSHHGVTTVVAGNCGFSLAPTRPELRDLVSRRLEKVEDMNFELIRNAVPWDFETFPQYLNSVRRHGSAINFGAYIGHTALRLYVMGAEGYDRAANDEEVAAMAAHLREAMFAGAAGFATSFAQTHNGADGRPVPSRMASLDEVTTLMRVIADVHRGIVSLTPGTTFGIDAIYEMQRRVGVPFTYGALLTSPTGTHETLLAKNQEEWERGAQVWPQVSPRPLAFSFTMDKTYLLDVNPFFAELGTASLAERRAAYSNPTWRERAWKAFDECAMPPRWNTYEMGDNHSCPDLDGVRVDAVALSRGVSPLDVILDLALGEPDLSLRVRCVIANDDHDAVGVLLQDEHCTLGLSDAGAHVSQLCDAPQATDFLGNWVRERCLLPLEAGVRKLTGVQADLLRFPDRGYLRPGAWADVVVFDPHTIAPGPIRRVNDFPGGAERLTADEPIGISHVIVNGTVIRRGGIPLDEADRGLPGQVVGPEPRS